MLIINFTILLLYSKTLIIKNIGKHIKNLEQYRKKLLLLHGNMQKIAHNQ